jgi:hypothetical protein
VYSFSVTVVVHDGQFLPVEATVMGSYSFNNCCVYDIKDAACACVRACVRACVYVCMCYTYSLHDAGYCLKS